MIYGGNSVFILIIKFDEECEFVIKNKYIKMGIIV